MQSTGTSVASDILVDPGIQFKAVESYALAADTDLGEVRPNFLIEAVAVHAEVGGNVPEADQARQDPQEIALAVHRPR